MQRCGLSPESQCTHCALRQKSECTLATGCYCFYCSSLRYFALQHQWARVLMCCDERPALLSIGGCSAVMQVDAFCTNLPSRYPPSQSSRPIHLEMHWLLHSAPTISPNASQLNAWQVMQFNGNFAWFNHQLVVSAVMP